MNIVHSVKQELGKARAAVAAADIRYNDYVDRVSSAEQPHNNTIRL